MKSGEKYNGVVMEIKHDTLGAVVNGRWQRIPLNEVSSLFFNEHVAYDGSYDPSEPFKKISSGPYTIRYQMKGRKITQPPVISNATENSGTVVVKVTIDQYGNVIRAKPGFAGSTTSSEYLYIKAEFAARSTRFDATGKGPVETSGTIAITY